MFYSQFGEDRMLASLFEGRKHGLCVEVGANDGVNDSTTYYFEQLGWDCVLVEPSPGLCRDIRAVRGAHLFECAASAQEGLATLHIAEGAERSHGVSGLDAEAARRISGYGFSSRPIEVPTRRLDAILEEASIGRNPDFVSIDVEGHELEVLKGFSVERWRPTVIIAEDNSQFENKSVSRYLRSFGYVPFRRTGVNDWYAHRSQRHIVTTGRRWSWNWTALKTRARKRLAKMPALRALRSILLPR